MYRLMVFVIATLVAILAAGCTVPALGAPDNGTPAPSNAANQGIPQDVAGRAVEWVSREANVDAGSLRLVRAERAEWTDSCFGLGGPAESCLQAVTPGWRITLEASGRQYEVRSDESGSIFRLAPQGS